MMWPHSGEARAAVAEAHWSASRLDVLQAGRPVYTLTATGGQVQAQAGRTVLRNLSATVVDPTGALSGGDIDDLLSAYGCEVAAYRGVVLTSGTVWAPQGVFGLTQKQVAGDGSVQLTGQDRAMVYQGGMDGSLPIPGSTPIETAIARLLAKRNAGVQALLWATGFTCGPLLYAADIDVWAECQKLAQSVGGWLYHDREGDLIFAPLAPTSTTPVARWGDGDGLLIKAARTEDADTIRNVVVVTSAKTGTGGVIQAVAEDTDPTSPTYARGRYGRRVMSITNQHVGSVAQAQQAATAALVRELGRSETVAIEAVPNPFLDPLDAVTVNRPSAGLVEHTVIVDSITVPLAATDSMSVGCRKYLLTRDGQSIQTGLETLS